MTQPQWKGLRNHINDSDTEQSEPTTDIVEALQTAVSRLSRHGVPLTERTVVLSNAFFQELRTHEDVTSGRMVLEEQPSNDGVELWRVTIPELGESYTLVVSPDYRNKL